MRLKSISSQVNSHLSLSFLLLVIAVGLSLTGLLQRSDNLVYDTLTRLRQTPPSDDTVIVAIDDHSLKELGRWPWPRRFHAQLIKRLTETGVKAIVLDLLLSEPDAADQKGDQKLAAAMLSSGQVFLPVSYDKYGEELRESLPLPMFQQAAAALGHVEVALDADSLARRIYLEAGLDEPRWPFLAAEVLQATQHLSHRVSHQAVSEFGTQSLQTNRWIMKDPMLIPFSGPQGRIPRISYVDVIHPAVESRVDTMDLRDKYVFVGATARGMGDSFAVPVSQQGGPMPGVEILATMLDGLKGGRVVHPLGPFWDAIISALLVVFAVAGAYLRKARWTLFSVFFFMSLTMVIAWFALSWFNRWFNPSAAIFVLLISYPILFWQHLESAIGNVFRERNRSRVTLQSISDAVITTSSLGLVEYMNPAAELMAGSTLSELKGRPLDQVLRLREGNNWDLDTMVAKSAQRGNAIQTPELGVFSGLSGEGFTVQLAVSPVANEKGHTSGAVLTFKDISEHSKLAEQLAFQATHHALTELPNRTLLLDRLTRAIDHATYSSKSIAVLLLDLDGMRTINCGLGHVTSDTLLLAVAERLKQGCIANVCTLAHISGDEFVIVLEELKSTDRVTIEATAIIDHFRQAFMVHGEELFLSCRLGISLFPKDGTDAEYLLANANAALTQAKSQATNSLRYYSQEMNRHALRRVRLEKELHYALQREEFEVHYQPKVSLTNGRVVGVEALVRWQHPSKGLILPAKFISFAEETGLIIDIGNWVLRRVCKQARTWRDAGLPLQNVAINLAPGQLLHDDLLSVIESALMESGFAPEFLNLEITENALINELGRCSRVLKTFKAMGGTVSVDDFGTGYSALSYLKDLPIDQLKIDRSFIQDMTTDPAHAALTLAVINMAHSLGMKTVAEGVETAQQLQFLRDRHCDEIQGFYFSRPLPPEQMTKFLGSRHVLHFQGDLNEIARTVLLVDDDPSILSLVEAVLAKDQYKVLKAIDGKDALALLAHHRVGVIISDKEMPGISGITLLAQVRELHPQVVRVMLSGMTDTETLIASINHGAIFKFLRKPVVAETLRRCVRDAFLKWHADNQQLA